jgi:hypothetical protein
MYVLGNDASHHQLDYNSWKNKKAGMKFAIFRASYGEYVNHDKFFRDWYKKAYYSNYEYGVSAYHFLKPGHDFNKQMEWFQIQMESVPRPNLSPLENMVFLDCEHDDEKDKDYISEFIQRAAEFVKKHITRKKYPGIYTSSGWWDEHVLASDYWKKLPLWVAHWTLQEKPLLPRDWNSWHIWQFAVLKGQGKSYGWASEDIDINRMKIKAKEEVQLFMPIIMKDTINLEMYAY